MKLSYKCKKTEEEFTIIGRGKVVINNIWRPSVILCPNFPCTVKFYTVSNSYFANHYVKVKE